MRPAMASCEGCVGQLMVSVFQRHATSSRSHSPLVRHVRCRQSRLNASRSWHCSATTCSAQAAAGSNGLAQKAAGMLGYLVLLGSLVRSLPQCIRIVKSKSAEGVSLSAVVAELVAFTITIAYNVQRGHLFSTWGEIFACWLQDVLLIFLICNYRQLINSKLWVGAAMFAAYTYVLVSGWVPQGVLALLQVGTVAIITFGARIPQIVLNHRRGNTGELSLFTCLLNLAGCVARLYTTTVLTQDGLILAGTATQTVLNSILITQVLMSASRQNAPPSGPQPSLL